MYFVGKNKFENLEIEKNHSKSLKIFKPRKCKSCNRFVCILDF